MAKRFNVNIINLGETVTKVAINSIAPRFIKSGKSHNVAGYFNSNNPDSRLIGQKYAKRSQLRNKNGQLYRIVFRSGAYAEDEVKYYDNLKTQGQFVFYLVPCEQHEPMIIEFDTPEEAAWFRSALRGTVTAYNDGVLKDE